MNMKTIEYLKDLEYAKNEMLLISCEVGWLDGVKFLVSQGADPHFDDEGPLMVAVVHGHLDVVKYLIEECGADPHINNDQPLFEASAWDQFEIVKYLIEKHRSDPNVCDLELVEANGGEEIVKYIKNKIFASKANIKNNIIVIKKQ